MLRDGVAEVWWARLTDGPGRAVALLDETEQQRLGRYRFEADRTRFALGAAMVRLAAARYLGLPAEEVRLDRTCPDCGEPHGKVRVLDAGELEVSVTHSGELVGVAFARRPVGLDVERLRSVAGIEEQVLHAAELRRFRDMPVANRNPELLRIWTRKEAFLKATGEGLRADLTKVVLDELPTATHLIELYPAADHVAALALLAVPDAAGTEVRELDGDELFAARGRG